MDIISSSYEGVIYNICHYLLTKELHTLSCTCKYARKFIEKFYWFIEIQRTDYPAIYIKYNYRGLDISSNDTSVCITAHIIISTTPEIYEIVIRDSPIYCVADNKNILAKYKDDNCVVIQPLTLPVVNIYDPHIEPDTIQIYETFMTQNKYRLFNKHIVVMYEEWICIFRYIRARVYERIILYPNLAMAPDIFAEIYEERGEDNYSFILVKLCEQRREYAFVNNEGFCLLTIVSPELLTGRCKYRAGKMCHIMFDQQSKTAYLLNHNRKKSVQDWNIMWAHGKLKKLHRRLCQDSRIV